MQPKDPKPEILRLEELAISVKAGDIKLPRFQRPFVWQKQEMLKLLDSIYKGYPIGSLLIWHSSQKLTSERSIYGLQIDSERPAYFPTNYLLDGQQRLTTLCGALYFDGLDLNSKWNIHFDLETEQFVYPKDADVVNLFPLNRIVGTSDFIRQCMKFEHHKKQKKFTENAERLLRSIKDYKIAVVKIGDMTIEEVAPIFERINSTGRKLTIVDLMMAATWSDGFDLGEQLLAIKKECRAVGFDGIEDAMVLRSIAGAAGLGINKDDIQKLRSKKAAELKAACEAARNALVSAFRFLKDRPEIAIESFSFVPYGLQVTHLAEAFRLRPAPSTEMLEELSRWFWFTSVTRYFTAASTGQTTKDLASMRAFARGDTKELFAREAIDLGSLLFDNFNLRNASSTAFACLLGSLRPTRSVDGRAIDQNYLRVKSAKFFGSFDPLRLQQWNVLHVIHPFTGTVSVVGVDELELQSHLLSEEVVRAEEDLEALARMRGKLVGDRVSALTDCPIAAIQLRFESSALIDEDIEFESGNS